LGAHVAKDDKLSQIAQIYICIQNLIQLGDDQEYNSYHASCKPHNSLHNEMINLDPSPN
jgi:hypothetical protein